MKVGKVILNAIKIGKKIEKLKKISNFERILIQLSQASAKNAISKGLRAGVEVLRI